MLSMLVPANLERTVVPARHCDITCWHRPGEGRQWVLWLHGAAGSASSFVHQMHAFEGADLLFLDIRGQGQSPMHLGHRVHFEDAVDDVGAVLDAFGAELQTFLDELTR